MAKCADLERRLTECCGEAVARTAADHDVDHKRLVGWLWHATGEEVSPVLSVGVPDRALRTLEDRRVLKAGPGER
ncbi:hypothetical protein [Actinomadura sp. DC4]|uniref:hypothetical protein n=1 Tax=Actinomadura sp. DC4 TaxID=3055069 RepID=UPI0025B04A34|nr:hypothetical protein [Actinomadura sp. DC4]MDN3353815.1 hypothetical protein [Actinomadura sp. DC4]